LKRDGEPAIVIVKTRDLAPLPSTESVVDEPVQVGKMRDTLSWRKGNGTSTRGIVLRLIRKKKKKTWKAIVGLSVPKGAGPR